MSYLKVLVIGAGVTGLLIAQGLKKQNVSFEIFEREPFDATKHSRDWSMALHWGSNHFATCLPQELLARLKVIQCDPFYEDENGNMPDVPFRNGATAEVLATVPAKGLWRVSQRKMRMLFSEGLEVQYGKKLASISITPTSVTATFTDGSTTTGSHLVGADGAKSSLRSLLLASTQASLIALPTIMYNFKTTFSSSQARYLKSLYHPIMNFGIHPDTNNFFMISILDMPDKDSAGTWIWQIFFSVIDENDSVLRLSSKEKLVILKERAEKWTEPWKSAMIWVPEGTEVPTDVGMYWKDPIAWGNKECRVTLAGDAAHAMPPYRAQGANNAIQDAANYVEAMKKVRDGADMKETMNAYDEEMLDRGRREISLAIPAAMASHSVSTFAKGPLATIGLKRRLRQVDAAILELIIQ